ncbi:MAG: hypothetical protein PUB10_08360 [Clostridiales bacterium]|nr:hypothetical protein [Clostridiales bacterium]
MAVFNGYDKVKEDSENLQNTVEEFLALLPEKYRSGEEIGNQSAEGDELAFLREFKKAVTAVNKMKQSLSKIGDGLSSYQNEKSAEERRRMEQNAREELEQIKNQLPVLKNWSENVAQYYAKNGFDGLQDEEAQQIYKASLQAKALCSGVSLLSSQIGLDGMVADLKQKENQVKGCYIRAARFVNENAGKDFTNLEGELAHNAEKLSQAEKELAQMKADNKEAVLLEAEKQAGLKAGKTASEYKALNDQINLLKDQMGKKDELPEEQEKLDSLNGKIAEAQKQVQEWEKRKKTMSEFLLDNQKLLAKDFRILDDVKEKHITMDETQLQELQQRAEGRRKQQEETEKELRDIDSNIERFQKVNAAFANEKKSLEQSIEQKKQREAEWKVMQEQIEDLKNKLQSKTSECKEVEAQYRSAKKALAAWKDSVKTLEERCGLLQREGEQLKDAVSQVAHGSKEYVQKVNDYSEQVNRLENVDVELTGEVRESLKGFLDREKDGQKDQNRTNSNEFNNMINALKESQNEQCTPQQMRELVDRLQQAAQAYKTAKEKQWRPFPSNMRLARLGLADSLIQYCQNVKKQYESLDVSMAEIKTENKLEEMKKHIGNGEEERKHSYLVGLTAESKRFEQENKEFEQEPMDDLPDIVEEDQPELQEPENSAPQKDPVELVK